VGTPIAFARHGDGHRSLESTRPIFGRHAGRRLRWNLMNCRDRPPTTGTGEADTGYERRPLS
jgi:hypothetical protein